MSSIAAHSDSLSGNILDSLNDEYAAVDLLPHSLLPAVLSHSAGDLNDRCVEIGNLRISLLEGTLPDVICSWMPEPVQTHITEVFDQTGVIRFCKNNEEVSDALIQDLLFALEEHSRCVSIISAKLVEQQIQHDLLQLKQELEAKYPKLDQRPEAELSNEWILDIGNKMEKTAWLQITSESGEYGILPHIWGERLEIWKELEAVFSDLELVADLGFDLSRGVLQSHGWMNLVRLHEVVKTLPQLREVIQALGRMKDADDSPTVLNEIFIPMMTATEQKKEVATPFVPMETRGITRSDSISRMLPQEAALLGHPTLKTLFYAKRAEHSLLSYAVEGTEIFIEDRDEYHELKQDVPGNTHSKNRGPMIICLDTSGSMHGTPETVAKALVLECLSVAKKEERACYVYLFGSYDEVEELELTPTNEGLERMIHFLSMSFGGGTEAEGPLNLALEQSEIEEWDQSDILIVSDGEFYLSDEIIDKVVEHKESRSLSVHGVLIGNHSTSMKKVCEPLHQFSEWLDLQVRNHRHY